MNTHSGSATMPRGFRYTAPTTPEPVTAPEEARLSSPSRPRLRLKRRNVSQHLGPPTQQFLASVAAADVPIPSIEQQQQARSDDPDMMGMYHLPEMSVSDGFERRRGKTFSPPKTPAPDSVPALTPTRYPDWTVDSNSSSVESTPDPDYGSRPSTSRSTQTSASFFSRQSQLSDNERCPSPVGDNFGTCPSSNSEDPNAMTTARPQRKPRKAPWTKAMSDHLWNTYKLYLQDPKVTPFRMGNSSIPPHGVLLRVAREAKRSWKGSKALRRAEGSAHRDNSGSRTPTGEESSPFIEWPHTCASSRARLRDLCRLKASSGNNNRYAQTAARRWNRRSTSARSPSVFGTQGMSISLAISTSDSMQPNGPLAQLTNSIHMPLVADAEQKPSTGRLEHPFQAESSLAERRRLGWPMGPQSYGPSSSHSLAAALELNDPLPRRQNHTMGTPRRTLQSPVRMSRSSSITKRRNTNSNIPRKRPGIFSDIFLDPTTAGPLQATATTEFSSTQESHRDKLFIPRVHADLVSTTSTSMPTSGSPTSPKRAPLMEPVPRLGSPFDGSNQSFTFPNRLHRHQQSVDLGTLGRPFSPYQTDSSEAIRNTHLKGRLAYMDQRLRELQNRDASRTSSSPK